MKNLLLLFVGLILISCGKQEPDSQAGLNYPVKYIFNRIEFNESKLFKIDRENFEQIPMSSSFLSIEDSIINVLENELNEYSEMKEIILLNDDEVRVLSVLNVADTMNYSNTTNDIQLHITPTFYLVLEKSSANELKHCMFFAAANSPASVAINLSDCFYSSEDEEIIKLRMPRFPQPDSFMFNISSYFYTIEE